MELRFTEAILPETTPPSANFLRCNKIKVTSTDVRATIGRVELTLATVETKNGLILYRINPEAYSFVHACPRPERPWAFYNIEIRGQ